MTAKRPATMQANAAKKEARRKKTHHPSLITHHASLTQRDLVTGVALLGTNEANIRAARLPRSNQHRFFPRVSRSERGRRHAMFLHPAGGRAHAGGAEESLERAGAAALERVGRRTRRVG